MLYKQTWIENDDEDDDDSLAYQYLNNIYITCHLQTGSHKDRQLDLDYRSNLIYRSSFGIMKS